MPGSTSEPWRIRDLSDERVLVEASGADVLIELPDEDLLRAAWSRFPHRHGQATR